MREAQYLDGAANPGQGAADHHRSHDHPWYGYSAEAGETWIVARHADLFVAKGVR